MRSATPAGQLKNGHEDEEDNERDGERGRHEDESSQSF